MNRKVTSTSRWNYHNPNKCKIMARKKSKKQRLTDLERELVKRAVAMMAELGRRNLNPYRSIDTLEMVDCEDKQIGWWVRLDLNPENWYVSKDELDSLEQRFDSDYSAVYNKGEKVYISVGVSLDFFESQNEQEK